MTLSTVLRSRRLSLVLGATAIATSIGLALYSNAQPTQANRSSATNSKKVTQLPLDIVRGNEAQPLSAADTIAIHELINRVYLAEDSKENGNWKIAHRVYDQFAVQPEILPDPKLRQQASQAIAIR
jgi:hypothetical protein